MKIVLFLIIFCSIFFAQKKGVCQFAIAGIPGANYMDVSPDTLLNPPHGINSYSESFFIDINMDGLDDIKIFAYTFGGQIFVGDWTEVSSLNPATSISIGQTDSTYISYINTWSVRDILAMYDNYDTIKNANFKSRGYLGFASSQYGTGAASTQWLNTNVVNLSHKIL